MRMHVKCPIHKKYTINVSPRAKVKLTEERLGQCQMRVKTRKKDKTKLLSRQSFTAGVRNGLQIWSSDPTVYCLTWNNCES